MRYLRTLEVPIDGLQPFPGNARLHDDAALDSSAEENGQYRSVVAREMGKDAPPQVLAGHGTWGAFTRRGDKTIRVELIEATDREARRIVLADNATSRRAGYDERLLLELVQAADADGGLAGTGYDDDDLRDLLDSSHDLLDGDGDGDGDPPAPEPTPTLAERFFAPPFDVLNAREGWWQERKRRWLGMGITSELGRDGRDEDGESGLLYGSASGRDPAYYAKKRAAEAAVGRTLSNEEFEADHYDPGAGGGLSGSGTSVFNPVLCELAYRWFTAAGMTVLDPFAGGSVRGLVAAMLGRRYVGNDLRGEQVEANEEQRADFEARGLVAPGAVSWSTGDSADWVKTLTPDSADLVFTCPPYLWLEKYSDDPSDLSNASEDEFERLYAAIIAGAARALHPDRFAAFVVGDVRDSKGRLVDFRGMTIRAAEAAGLVFQSGAVLVTPVGSLPVRAGRSFAATRVLGRTHQDVLVFVKGDRRRAAQACGEVDVSVLDEIPSDGDGADVEDGDAA